MTSAGKVINARNMPDEEFFYGHKACAGCGGSVAVRLVLKVLGERAFSVLPANCMSAVGFIYPQMAFTHNAMIAPFAATGAMLSGVQAGLKALGVEDFYAVGFAGDGGTADIGIQALSGAIDRGDRIIYVCYDNEAYMNTGIQKSGLTPYGTRTTTSPAGQNLPGAVTHKKNMFEIVAAHGISYSATCSIGYPEDLLRKVGKAKENPGTSYIHILASCPTGWGIPTNMSIEVAKRAVDCGLWYLAEYEDGEFILNKNPKRFTSVEEYLMSQGRFKHLTQEDIEVIENNRDLKWNKIRKTYTTA